MISGKIIYEVSLTYLKRSIDRYLRLIIFISPLNPLTTIPNRQPGGIANKPNNYNNWNVGLLSCVSTMKVTDGE